MPLFFHSRKCCSVSRLAFVVAIAVCGTITLCRADELHSRNKAANKEYNAKNYEGALKDYDNLILEYPGEQKLKMNKGSALYRLGQYDKAEEAYNQAGDLKDKNALASLRYNLGNALYMEGEKLAEQNNSQQAMEKYKGALENYIKALDARPSDRDSKWNAQLVQKKIKQMQNQQQQQQNNKDNKQDKNDKNQNNQQNKQNQNKQNQDKNKQDQKQDQNQQNKNDRNKDQQNKRDQQNQQQNQPNKNEEQKPEPTPQQQKQEETKKDEAKRLIEQYSDDDKDLNKPQKRGPAVERKNAKDW